MITKVLGLRMAAIPFRIALALLIGAVFLGSFTPSAIAQGRPKRPQEARENIKGEGKVAEIGPGVLGIVGEGGDQWMVKLPNKLEDFAVSGKAERGFLKAGMWVEFIGTVGKRGQVAGPITDIVVFTPRPGYEVGITPSRSSSAPAGGLFSSEEEEKPKKAKPAAEEPTEYRIAAAINKVGRKGEITVSASGVTLKADVAEDAKIKIDVADLQYVSVGDKVEFEGYYYETAKNQVYSSSLTVTAAQPFTDAKKTKGKPAAAKAGEKTTDAKGADGKEVPADDSEGSGKEKAKAGAKEGKEKAGKDAAAAKDTDSKPKSDE